LKTLLSLGCSRPSSRASWTLFETLPREIEILDYIARGLSNKEIGRALGVAPETIKWHLKNIVEKLNVGSRVEAVQRGLGLVRPAHPGAGAGHEVTASKPAAR
jgi:LuxR family maltose regulon positive regulatory protein